MMYLTYLLLCLITRLDAISYEGYTVFQVSPSTELQFTKLQQLETSELITICSKISLSYGKISVLIAPNNQKSFQSEMSYNKIPCSVLIEDYQKAINEEKIANDICAKSNTTDTSISFKVYHRYDKIQHYLQVLAHTHWPIVKMETFGKTAEGRNLEVITICNGERNRKPAILIDCGIHAREWISLPMCLYIIQQLAENGTNSNMFENVDWIIIPIMNPDGYEYSHTDNRMWRKNRSPGKVCKGVDLNRNFDVNWGTAATSKDECHDTFGGPNAFSELESRAFRRFIQKYIDNIKLYLSFHSYGSYILHPWGYTNDLPDNNNELDDLGRQVAAAIESVRGTRYTIGSSSNVIYLAAGGSDDWIKKAGNVKLSYTIELPSGGSFGFDPPASEIEPIVSETFKGIEVFYKYIENKFGGE